jgi:hypothetical protein
MFGSVPDRGHESSGVSVPVLIPWPFVWRHGGRSVSLCGSFTGWEAIIIILLSMYYYPDLNFSCYCH